MSNFLSRLHEEIDEVLGDKQSVDADDLDNLKYTEQVISTDPAVINNLACSHVSHYVCTDSGYQGNL